MSTGIERAPVYPAMPAEPLTNAQVESLVAFQSIDEHRQLVEQIFGLDTDNPYRITAADLEARRRQMAEARELGHHHTRSARELGTYVLATVPQMEDEFRRQTMLDIGSGTGRFGEAMARNAKAEVTFLDRDPEILKRISKRAGKIVLADGTDLPFEDESFQKVLSGFSSVHWAETPLESARALNEAIRVTEVGGSTLVIPLLNVISQRRQLLPKIFNSEVLSAPLEAADGYAAAWAMEDMAVINSLFKLAEGGYLGITWSNHLEETGRAGVSRELYSVIIDKQKSIPQEVYEQNIAYARQLMDTESED
jgi:ubiquinone/menaquinone biosynthesis C-methylase UbiE